MLDFRNLSYQIQGARDRGYQEKEICIAVVQSIKAGLQLRGYLEGVPNLTLETLFKRLRQHFKVKDASTMFREMEQTVQWEDETEETYCYRMLRLKQDVTILSRQDPHPYDSSLIQTRFQHALYTGLKNENIRQQLKSSLKQRTITDDELLDEIHEITLAESEHKEKLEKKNDEVLTKPAKVNALGAEEKKQSKAEKANKDFLVHITKLHTEQMEKMTALTNMLANNTAFQGGGGGGNQNTGRRNNAGRRGWRRGLCPTCVAANVPVCHHCFTCGSTEHKRQDCPRNVQDGSLNTQGL